MTQQVDETTPAVAALRAFAGGVCAGNGLPHLLNGLVRNEYPCKAGNGIVPNTVAGSVALALVPLIVGKNHAVDARAKWILGLLGASVMFGIHMRFGGELENSRF